MFLAVLLQHYRGIMAHSIADRRAHQAPTSRSLHQVQLFCRSKHGLITCFGTKPRQRWFYALKCLPGAVVLLRALARAFAQDLAFYEL
jgi:hypothetical protein